LFLNAHWDVPIGFASVFPGLSSLVIGVSCESTVFISFQVAGIELFEATLHMRSVDLSLNQCISEYQLNSELNSTPKMRTDFPRWTPYRAGTQCQLLLELWINGLLIARLGILTG